jgi:nucleoside diphosphate kinase
MPKEIIQGIESPIAFSRKVIGETMFVNKKPVVENRKDFVISELEEIRLKKIAQVLEHPGLNTLIDEGKITFAAIKPRTEESKLGVNSDVEGEKMLRSMIKPPLSPVFSITLALTEEDLDQFYPPEVRERLAGLHEGDSNIWDNFKKYMITGPITYMLLYSEQGNAVDEWRSQMGNTNPANADPESIRGKYALSIRQNLVHGSSGDSDEEKTANVRSESKWLLNQVTKLIDSLHESKQTNLLSESLLREVGVISNDEKLMLIRRILEPRRAGGESFLSAFSAAVETKEGEIDVKFIAEKSIVSFGGFSSLKAKSRVERLRLLRESGANTVKVYGLKGSTIYEEYIFSETTPEETINKIKSGYYGHKEGIRLVNQLVAIARALDQNGFVHVGSFFSDLIFNGENFYFVDGGSDLGDPNPSKPNNLAMNQLRIEFKNTNFINYIN